MNKMQNEAFDFGYNAGLEIFNNRLPKNLDEFVENMNCISDYEDLFEYKYHKGLKIKHIAYFLAVRFYAGLYVAKETDDYSNTYTTIYKHYLRYFFEMLSVRELLQLKKYLSRMSALPKELSFLGAVIKGIKFVLVSRLKKIFDRYDDIFPPELHIYDVSKNRELVLDGDTCRFFITTKNK